jgi:hypothetical protein
MGAMHPAAFSAGFLVHPVSGLLSPWLDPNEFLRDPALGPWIVAVVCAFLFVETGLLVGFFLPGDLLLFTAGLADPGTGLRRRWLDLDHGEILPSQGGRIRRVATTPVRFSR